MRKFILLFAIGSLPLQAQELTLQQVLQNAKSQEVFQSEKQNELDAVQLKIQKSKRLPLLYGDANVQRNLIVPVTPVPAIAFDPNAAPGEITPLRFATDWSSKAGLQFSMDIFNPLNHTQIEQAKINQQKSAVNQTNTILNFENSIKNLYAQVVLAQEQEKVAVKLRSQYQETLFVLEQRYKAGRLSDLEMNTAQMKVYELEKLVEEARVVLLNKRIALLPFIDLNLDEVFSTSLKELLRLSQSETNTTESQNLLIDRKWKAQQIKNIDLQALPKLTLNGYYGSQFFNNQFKIVDTNNWYGSSFVNLTLRVPITETYERILTKKQLEIESSILASQYASSVKQDYVRNAQKINDIALYLQMIQQNEKILVLALENVAIVKVQLEEGTVLVTELNKQLEKYLDEQKKLWQSQYDFIQKLLN